MRPIKRPMTVITQVEQKAKSQAKCMDKNQVALLFEALRCDENGIYRPICDAVLSEPIRNQSKSKKS